MLTQTTSGAPARHEPQRVLDLTGLAREAAAAETGATETPLVPRSRSIAICYRDPEGRWHEGTVTSVILGGEGRIQLGVLCAKLARAPWGTLPPALQSRAYQLAVCTLQLQEPPEWLLRWLQEDDDLLAEVYLALEDHERGYFRRGDGEGAEAARRTDVVVRPLDTAAGAAVSKRPDAG